MSVWIYVIIVGAGAPRRVSVTAERRGTDKPTPTGSCVAVTITRGTPNGGGGEERDPRGYRIIYMIM